MIDFNAISANERQKNIYMVLNQIALRGEVSSADIVNATGLSFATVSRAVNTLKKAGVALTVGKEQTDMGRRPDIIGLNASFGLLLHFSVDAELLKGYLADFCGSTIGIAQKRINRSISPDDFGKELRECANQLVAEHKRDYSGILAASIAIPGLVDTEKRLVRRIPNFVNFKNRNLFDYAQQALAVPVIIHNEARLSAVGCYMHDFPEYKNIVFIDFTKYSGIGSGIIVDGKLVSGKNGFAGEIGDILVDIHNFEHSYNEDEGCLEEMAGVGVLYAKLEKLMHRGRANILREIMTQENATAPTLRMVEQAVLMQDLDVADVFEDVMRKWTIAVINFSAMLDPDIIILGGVVNHSNDVVLARIGHNVSKILNYNVNIVLNETDEHQMHGGIYMLKSHIFNTMLAEKLFSESKN